VNMQAETKKLQLLLVDDEPLISRVCKRVLTSEGFEVDVASDGIMAKEQASAKHYNICVCDIRMPGLTGMQLFQYWKTNNHELAHHTVFMTGDTLGQEVQEFLTETGMPYIMKPFPPDDLVAKVNELLVRVTPQ
jgi:DNA-binding response OmpR family regulator